MRPTNLRRRLARNLERLRTKRGWSLSTLADFAGVAHATVIWVADEETSCKLDTLAKLAGALEVDPAELLKE